jgi:hypothetical protein
VSGGYVGRCTYEYRELQRFFTYSLVLPTPISYLCLISVYDLYSQFVYWSWFSNSLYHGSMGLMQGLSLEQSYQRICDVLWETQKAQWVFWIPIQLLNFRFVPVRHQLNVVLLTSVVWTALLSAWYPPATKEESDSAEALKKEAALEAALHD